MDDILTHELIHAYDDCKVEYDPHNLKQKSNLTRVIQINSK